ncbi:hypothetical protein V8G54_024425, partial [Vigna mungo]
QHALANNISHRPITAIPTSTPTFIAHSYRISITKPNSHNLNHCITHHKNRKSKQTEKSPFIHVLISNSITTDDNNSNKNRDSSSYRREFKLNESTFLASPMLEKELVWIVSSALILSTTVVAFSSPSPILV